MCIISFNRLVFSGFGQTIQEAKDVAAMNILSRMFGLSDSSNPMKFDKTLNMCEWM